MAKYLIIGGSTAGLAAVRAIRSVDKNGEIIMVSEEEHQPYSRVLLTHYIAGHVGSEDLKLVGDNDFHQMNVRLIRGVRAIDLIPGEKKVVLNNGLHIHYTSLLISTGARPSLPPNIPLGIQGITGLRTIEDANYIRQKALQGAKVVILGGGLVGVKLACALKEVNCNPQMIIQSPHILSKVSDDEAALIVEKWMKEKGIMVRTNSRVEQVIRDDTGVKGVILSGGKFISCDILAVCKGVRSNTSFISHVLPSEEGIKVNENMLTELPDVYAAGDVAKAYEITSKDFRVVAIWPHAVEQGRVAGLNMAGEKCVYRGSLSRNALEILGLPFISMGIVNPDTRQGDWDIEVESRGNEYRKLVYRDGKLVGAILIGEVEEAGRLQAVIRENNL